MRFIITILIFMPVLLAGCKEKAEQRNVMFQVLQAAETGLHFRNDLTPTDSFNVFRYMYFYNGAGIGAGDFNRDGLIDLFFASNQADNKLYLNRGQLQFEDVTAAAAIPHDGGWSTGVSVVDINNDGLLDIYVCRVGNYEVLSSRNQLLVCTGIKDGIPQFEEQAERYGIGFSGFSTQAAFFDYDADEDLDLFLLNHAVHQNGSFAERSRFLPTYDSLSGDRMYRNDGGHFTDVTRNCGIQSSGIGYGLGVVVSDINLDGYPDLYIGNDFHENDYLYINQKNGLFLDELEHRLMHTSQFSMGVDVADITNDGYPEIVAMDMLPSDPYILKRSLGEDDYNTFFMKIRYGYNYQYTRNTLQLNRRNGLFSEVGLYAGIATSDWSWAPLWVDFDNDGWKDLFISNGIPKRLNDIDYVNYVSNEEVQKKINARLVDEKEMAIIDKFPQIKIPNKLYRNKTEASFEDMSAAVAGDQPSYSNGAVYADLDNDGDLDIVVNNIDDAVLVYRNNTNDVSARGYIDITLKGSRKNVNAIGAKLVLFDSGHVYSYEKSPVRGFLSSMETPLHVGLEGIHVDSAFLIWPDQTWQRLSLDSTMRNITVNYQGRNNSFDYTILTRRWPNKSAPASDITSVIGLSFLHSENHFNEFDREPLIPFMVSREGPALAVTDMNGDGLDDFFIGSSKKAKSAVFVQELSGRFRQLSLPDLDNDSTYEDVDACWADLNLDGHPDLVVASGGNEYYGRDPHLLPRMYLNDGKGNLKKQGQAFDMYMTASTVVAGDVNGDGYIDLFFGGRAVPWEYGEVPRSYLLLNDGFGRFSDVSDRLGPGLAAVGMVKDAVWIDIDKNGWQDLVIATEWGPVYSFMNSQGQLKKQKLTEHNGWWNFLLPVDVNSDGAIDFIAGNLGLNSRLKASFERPVRLLYNDFDDNGKREQILTYFLEDRELPFANKDELQKQLPFLRKKFVYADDFARASLAELFGKAKLESSAVRQADYFANALLLNNGKGRFTTISLPWEAQLTSYRDAIVVDANGDALPDVLLGGNFYDNNIQMGRYDADYGMLLVNRDNGQFECSTLNGFPVKGQVRRLKRISMGSREAILLAINNDSLRAIEFRSFR